MTTWLTDGDGNRCSVEHFDTKEKAQFALDSLTDCKDCINCTYCAGCTNCKDCAYCISCIGCISCKGVLAGTRQAEYVTKTKIKNFSLMDSQKQARRDIVKMGVVVIVALSIATLAGVMLAVVPA